MKKLILLAAMVASNATYAFDHSQSSASTTWNELDRYVAVPEASVPITIHHSGSETDYVITVNNRIVSNVFTMSGKETLKADVPVELEDRHGAQTFKVCSRSMNHEIKAGASVCNEVELFLLYPSED